MKRFHYLIALLFVFVSLPLQAQKKGLESIKASDLKTHMLFLSSDELKGRDTGEPGMQIAARYLAVQAESLGLQPLDKNEDYLQPYIIEEKAYDRENSGIAITAADGSQALSTEPFYMFPAPGGDHTIIEGEQQEM